MNETEAINEKFTQFLEEFKDLEKYLESLLKGKSLQNVSEQISLTENAKLNTALAYLINSLYFSNYSSNNWRLIFYLRSLYEDKRYIHGKS